MERIPYLEEGLRRRLDETRVPYLLRKVRFGLRNRFGHEWSFLELVH